MTGKRLNLDTGLLKTIFPEFQDCVLVKDGSIGTGFAVTGEKRVELMIVFGDDNVPFGLDDSPENIKALTLFVAYEIECEL